MCDTTATVSVEASPFPPLCLPPSPLDYQFHSSQPLSHHHWLRAALPSSACQALVALKKCSRCVTSSPDQTAEHPWSPQVNPNAYASSTWKFHYRVYYLVTENKAVDAAKSEKCQHYFDHTRYPGNHTVIRPLLSFQSLGQTQTSNP